MDFLSTSWPQNEQWTCVVRGGPLMETAGGAEAGTGDGGPGDAGPGDAGPE